MLKKRLLPTVSGSNGICSWIHASDVVSGTIAALERGRPGEVYNIVDDDPVSLNDFLIYAARVAWGKVSALCPTLAAAIAHALYGSFLLHPLANQ